MGRDLHWSGQQPSSASSLPDRAFARGNTWHRQSFNSSYHCSLLPCASAALRDLSSCTASARYLGSVAGMQWQPALLSRGARTQMAEFGARPECQQAAFNNCLPAGGLAGASTSKADGRQAASPRAAAGAGASSPAGEAALRRAAPAAQGSTKRHSATSGGGQPPLPSRAQLEVKQGCVDANRCDSLRFGSLFCPTRRPRAIGESPTAVSNPICSLR